KLAQTHPRGGGRGQPRHPELPPRPHRPPDLGGGRRHRPGEGRSEGAGVLGREGLVTGATLASTDYRRPGKGAQYLQRLGFQQHRNLFWSWYEPRNFGDWIGPYLYEKITGMMPRYLKPRKSVKACFFASAGSILRHIQVDDQAVVWGSGIISQDDT